MRYLVSSLSSLVVDVLVRERFDFVRRKDRLARLERRRLSAMEGRLLAASCPEELLATDIVLGRRVVYTIILFSCG